jgi:hypothetical protein
MINALRLSSFFIFVALGLALSFVADRGRRRVFVNVFLAYVLALNAFVVVGQKDAWPFSPYGLMTVDSSRRGVVRSMIAFRGVDGHGREWDIEPLAWSPLFPPAIMGWFEVNFPRATTEARDEVGRFLLDRAEEARRRRRAGAPIGNERLLGPLSAPDTHQSRPAIETASEPLVGIRVYRLTWIAEILLRDPSAVTRTLVFEYPR